MKKISCLQKKANSNNLKNSNYKWDFNKHEYKITNKLLNPKKICILFDVFCLIDNFVHVLDGIGFAW